MCVRPPPRGNARTASSPSITNLCIGCGYCAIACPYQARYKTDRASFAYGEPTAAEKQGFDPKRLAVATKCTFCVERIDAGLAKGLTPGIDPEATPACVNSCITQTLSFGDIEDPHSNVSELLAENQHFRCTRSSAPGRVLLPLGQEGGRRHEQEAGAPLRGDATGRDCSGRRQCGCEFLTLVKEAEA